MTCEPDSVRATGLSSRAARKLVTVMAARRRQTLGELHGSRRSVCTELVDTRIDERVAGYFINRM